MRAQIKLGRILGVEIGLHYSWFIIAFLITLSLAAQFILNNPDWSDGLRWSLAIITAAFFSLPLSFMNCRTRSWQKLGVCPCVQ